jgi:hypothetical protein
MYKYCTGTVTSPIHAMQLLHFITSSTRSSSVSPHSSALTPLSWQGVVCAVLARSPPVARVFLPFQVLMKVGADPNHADDDRTPLAAARANNHARPVAALALVQAGACAACGSSSGRRCLL